VQHPAIPFSQGGTGSEAPGEEPEGPKAVQRGKESGPGRKFRRKTELFKENVPIDLRLQGVPGVSHLPLETIAGDLLLQVEEGRGIAAGAVRVGLPEEAPVDAVKLFRRPGRRRPEALQNCIDRRRIKGRRDRLAHRRSPPVR